jgi:hypothetical protein
MVAYDQIRDAWVRAFMPPGGVVGTWMGYGDQQPADPWKKLFQGNQFLAWWALMSAADHCNIVYMGINLTPNVNFAEAAIQQREILSGLGKLFRHSRPEPRVFLTYSQVSAYMLSLLGRSYYEDTSVPAVRILESLAIPYSFIADEQADKGRLDAMKDKVFLLSGSIAMPAGTARAYAAAWERGCTLLADAGVATRDGHGTRLASGALDQTFGVLQQDVRESRTREPIAWTAAAPADLRKTSGSLIRALSGLRANGGDVWATFPDGTPAIVARRSKGGSYAIYLNTKYEWLGGDVTLTGLTQAVLAEAGVTSPVRVAPWDKHPTLAAEFVNGRARYYGALIRVAPGGAYDVEVSLPQKAHTYDMRTKKYLGETAQFRDNFDPKKFAKIYAQLPYAVKELAASVDAPRKRGGETVNVKGQVVAQAGQATEFHVIRCEVVRPDGTRPSYWQQNLSAPAGKFSVALPLALGDPRGAWRVELTDVASGAATIAQFAVE